MLELSTIFSEYLEKAFFLPALSDIRINFVTMLKRLNTVIPPGFWMLVCKVNHWWAVCSIIRKKFAKFRWQLCFLPTPAQKSAPLLNIKNFQGTIHIIQSLSRWPGLVVVVMCCYDCICLLNTVSACWHSICCSDDRTCPHSTRPD